MPMQAEDPLTLKDILAKIQELEQRITRLEERVQIYIEIHDRYFKLILALVSIIAGLIGLKIAVP